jgi:exodeoxyribonuclease III
MKIVTWNVNSIKARQEYVSLYLDHHQPDVLCVQELKMATEKVPVELFTSRGYQVAIHGQTQWNGVLIASKDSIDEVQMGLENGDEGQSRLIACETFGYKIVNLYCPQGQSEDSPKFVYKKKFYDRLIEWIEQSYTPEDRLIVTGDFNIAPQECDVWDVAVFQNVPTYHPEEHDRWKRLLSWGLEDVGRPYIQEGMFSFWDYRAGRFQRNQGMRIDHFLGTKIVQERVISCSVTRDFRKKKNGLKASDHAPVELIIE